MVGPEVVLSLEKVWHIEMQAPLMEGGEWHILCRMKEGVLPRMVIGRGSTKEAAMRDAADKLLKV